VPIFQSLETIPIVIAGIRIIYKRGIIENNQRRSDCPIRKNGLVKKYQLTTANTKRKIYAIGLLNADCNSRL